MSNQPPPPPLDAAPPPAPLEGEGAASSSPAPTPIPVLPAMPSIVPILTAGRRAGDGVHALSVPPGVTITQEPPPPSLALQLIASLADTAAIVGLVVLMARHTMTPEGGIAAIVAVLAARTKPVRLGAQAVSGVATLLLGAIQARLDKPSPPAPSPPAQ
jgi:hypothetical protein